MKSEADSAKFHGRFRCAGTVTFMILASAFALPSAAETGKSKASIGVGIGTGGIGIDYAYPLMEWLDLRAGYEFGSFSRGLEEDGIDYEADVSFSSARLLADFKPFRGGFRITGGIYTNTPDIELSAAGIDEYNVGDTRYRGDLMLDADVDIGSASPYLGIGWGGTAGASGIGVSFDVGLILGSSPDATLDVSGRACNSSAEPNCDPNGLTGFDVQSSPTFEQDRQREEQELEDEASDFKLWPILRVGLHYRF